MSVGTIGLIIIAIGLIKYYETVGGAGSVFALLGFPLMMIYLHYLEARAGISKKVLWSKTVGAIFLMIILFFIFFS